MKTGGIIHEASMILPHGIRSALKKYKNYIYRRYFNLRFGPPMPRDPRVPSEWYLNYLKRRFGDRVKLQDAGPPAPRELIKTEALMYADDLNVRAMPEWYFDTGRRDAWTVLSMVEKYGAEATAMRSVLEFGCGTARVLRHFRYIEGLRLAGTDANPKPIEWDRQNLPCIEFNHNELQPPLSYKNQSFDLIYALSVFTHIPLAWQGAWLDELHRVLRPGGYLLCTFHGENFVNSMLNSGDRLRLQRKGNLTLDAKSAQATYSTQVLGSWDVYQSRDEIRKAVGKNFEFLCYEPEATCHQDTVVLRKSASPV